MAGFEHLPPSFLCCFESSILLPLMLALMVTVLVFPNRLLAGSEAQTVPRSGRSKDCGSSSFGRSCENGGVDSFDSPWSLFFCISFFPGRGFYGSSVSLIISEPKEKLQFGCSGPLQTRTKLKRKQNITRARPVTKRKNI